MTEECGPYPVYVGTSLLNIKRANEIQERLISAGCIITYDWTTHGRVTTVEELTKFGALEEQGVRDADLFFMITPARTGSHFEMGLAHGIDKKIIILMEEEQEMKTFYYLPGVETFTDEDEAIQAALNYLKEST